MDTKASQFWAQHELLTFPSHTISSLTDRLNYNVYCYCYFIVLL